MGIVVYIASVTGVQATKSRQKYITDKLDAKGIAYTTQDITSDDSIKKKMREIAGNTSQTAPIVCNGDTFLGDYDAFFEAVEDENLPKFLQLED